MYRHILLLLLHPIDCRYVRRQILRQDMMATMECTLLVCGVCIQLGIVSTDHHRSERIKKLNILLTY